MATNVPARNDWCTSNITKLPTKKELATNYVMNMINRCLKMFEYNNLPKTINQKDLEFILQNKGYACICKVNGKLYAFDCTLGGESNAYYLPTIAIVTNPYLKFNEQLVIGKDCIIIKNSSTYQNLLDIHRKYAYLLAECDLSLKYGAWHSREVNLVVAENDSAKKDAEKILGKIIDGEDLGIIGGRQGLNNISTYPYSQGNDTTIKSLIELRQYIYASWYIDIGINANYNMKRESLNDAEVGINENTLLPLIDDMIDSRIEGIEEVNKLFGTDISVKLNSVWDKIQTMSELDTDLLQAQVESTKDENMEEVENVIERNDESNNNDETTSNE